jgi:hypothetical protein
MRKLAVLSIVEGASGGPASISGEKDLVPARVEGGVDRETNAYFHKIRSCRFRGFWLDDFWIEDVPTIRIAKNPAVYGTDHRLGQAPP